MKTILCAQAFIHGWSIRMPPGCMWWICECRWVYVVDLWATKSHTTKSHTIKL